MLDDSLGMRIYSFIDNILIITTIKQIKQKIDFAFFGDRHLGLIVTAVTINGFTPVKMTCFLVVFSSVSIGRGRGQILYFLSV